MFDFSWYVYPTFLLLQATPYIWTVFALIFGFYSFDKNSPHRLNMFYVFLPQSAIVIALWIFFELEAENRFMALTTIASSALVYLFTPRCPVTRRKSAVILMSGYVVFSVSLAIFSPSYYKEYQQYHHSKTWKKIHIALEKNDEADLKHQLSRDRR